MERRHFEQDHTIFRAIFREFLQREVVPRQDSWEEAYIVP